MKLAIMQPYFFPYIGYFQLLSAVETFVVYDNIEYTKKGWINRNRILRNGSAVTFSIPLKKASNYLNVNERAVSPDFSRVKLINQIRGSYQKAPFFHDVIALIEDSIRYEECNLFDFIIYSLARACSYLDIKTQIVSSSSVAIDHSLKGQDKVIALCDSLGATDYLNPIGGTSLYSKADFADKGVSLHFLKSKNISYRQFDNEFVPWLSIIDVMMFNSSETIRSYLQQDYELL